MANKKLRIGIMCLGDSLPQWQRLCIEKLLATGNAELSLIILDSPKNYPRRSLAKKITDAGFKNILFNIYLRFLYRPASIQTCSVADLFNSVPTIECVVKKKGKYSQYFTPEDIGTIKNHDLDIILRFGFNIIRGEILQSARYGVWSFHHDDEQKYRGGPPCFWEIYQNDPQTGSILQRLTEKLDAGVILKKGIFRTKNYSYARNVDQAYFESAKWPAMVCNDIVRGAADYTEAAPAVTHAPIYKYPDNLQLIRFLFTITANKLKAAWNQLFVMQYWNVGLIKKNVNELIQNPSGQKVSLLKHRNNKTFNADCFGIRTDNKVDILFEELDYSTDKKGKILFASIDNNGAEIARGEVSGIQNDIHSSYPFLFKEEDRLFMIPETGAKKQVLLYEADQKNGVQNWNKRAVLLDGAAFADTTLLKHEGKYWLFYTIHNEEYDGDLHLHIAYANKLDGPYTSHPQNPVKISARSARPAGNIFKDKNGNLIRPAQNFCKTYGGSVVLNKIDILTETCFKETEIDELKPFHPFYKDGLHTLNIIDEETVLVDMKRHVFRPFMKK